MAELNIFADLVHFRGRGKRLFCSGIAPPVVRFRDSVSGLAPIATIEVTPPMDSQNVDLKQTVNLPKTAFSMKANLPTTEPKLVERWEKEGLCRRIRESRAGRPTYVLHDG